MGIGVLPHNGTVSLFERHGFERHGFERHGFERARRIGKNRWAVTKVVGGFERARRIGKNRWAVTKVVRGGGLQAPGCCR